MKVVCISDTHGLHSKIRHIPYGDVLVHAGDCTNDIGQMSLRDFLTWFSEQPHKHKIFIAGNHDGAFEKFPYEARRMVDRFSGVTYLEDEWVDFDGVKFYGMPYTPAFCNWYFNSSPEQMQEECNKIPDFTDVLVTHGPPWGRSRLDVSGMDDSHCGSRELYGAVCRVQPYLHVFGHIHHGYGQERITHDMGNHTWSINASICNEKYAPVNAPWSIEV